eukprot:NODE_656_length_4979_cov_1.014754.p5 type:complete len:177 gc:universal NODE_656_length_4979_cov_1.014754:187-717(+)
MSISNLFRRKYCVFYMDDGGYRSTDEGDELTQELYFIGIIDILTPYNAKKKTESVLKRVFQDKYGVSAVKPSFYGERFFNFMRTLTSITTVSNNAPEFPPLPILESKLKEQQDSVQPVSLVQAFQKSNHQSYTRSTKSTKPSQIATFSSTKSTESSLSKAVEPILEKPTVASPTQE